MYSSWTAADLSDLLGAMPNKPRQSDAALKHTTTRAVVLIEACARVLTSAMKYGALVAVAYYCAESIKSLSGKTTLANIAVRVLGSVAVNQWVAYIIAGGCAAWAMGERRLRRWKIAELSKRPIELEKIIDPGRSSSNITEQGTTQEGD